MIYEQFLFSQLLRDLTKEYNAIAYDELFDIAQQEYEIFFETDFNNYNLWLYECITNYIQANEKDLIFKINDLI